MLPDFFGGGHIVIVGIVALLVIGPKDLPKMLRQLGKAVGAMRRMVDEFKTTLEDIARQSELDELRAEVERLRLGQAEIQVEPNAPEPAPIAVAEADLASKPQEARTRKRRASRAVEAQVEA